MMANFSRCRAYRYTLWRTWNTGLFTYAGKPDRYVNFICLNPSTADEVADDNTIRKCVKFAKTWGYPAMCVTNLFAYRSTDPEAMKLVAEPIGEDNDYFLENTAVNAALVIAAWSQHGSHTVANGRRLLSLIAPYSGQVGTWKIIESLLPRTSPVIIASILASWRFSI